MPQTATTTSLATVRSIARRAATTCIAVVVLSLAAAGCATDEPAPALPAAEQPSETRPDGVVSDDSVEAADDGLDPATTTFVADDSPVEPADTSGDAEPEATAADDESVDAPSDEPLVAETATNDADAVEEPTVPADVPATTVPSGEPTEPEAQQPQPDQDEPQPEAPATEDGTETPAAPEPQPEPEVVPIVAPSLVVDPVVVSAGSNTFTIKGFDFNPDLVIWLVLCALPGDSLSADTPADEIAAALGSIERSHCDLDTAQAMDVDSGGSFTAQRKANVIANFAWVASDDDDTQPAGGCSPHGSARTGDTRRGGADLGDTRRGGADLGAADQMRHEEARRWSGVGADRHDSGRVL